LWNHSLKRYCTDGGANRVAHRNSELAAPDVVIGDMDSIRPDVAEGLKRTVQLASRILLLGGTSGRFDHALAAINSLFYATSQLNQEVYCLDGENLTFVLNEGKKCIKIDRQCVTGTCGVVPFCQRETIVTMTGFRWNLG
uniref:Thiamine diphosphokinase n=1 Tax=Heligmosomoides polygyrus TaxID=6339 RepID=A0A183G578_HELPZ